VRQSAFQRESGANLVSSVLNRAGVARRAEVRASPSPSCTPSARLTSRTVRSPPRPRFGRFSLSSATKLRFGSGFGRRRARTPSFVHATWCARWSAITAWKNHVSVAVPTATGSIVQVASLTGDRGAERRARESRCPLVLRRGTEWSVIVHRIEDTPGNVVISAAESVPVNAQALSAYDGAHLAMAAARKRVAVVWLTKATLSSGESPGGWALFDCNE